jgi:anaerobic selenocysteine-containing dehydrogenase
MSKQTISTFCRVCEPACGLLAEVEDGVLTRLRPDREHPITRGFACNKGLAGVEIHHDPDRLDHPLRRGADGDCERIGWATAIDDIATRLRSIIETHGPEAVGYYVGNPTAFNTLGPPQIMDFLRQLGTRRGFNSGTQDCANKFAGSQAVFGTSTIHPVPDIERTDFLLILGANPRVSHWSFISLPDPTAALKAACRRGARVVFVNPRRIESVESGAGELVAIRPDTDVYLLAAMLCEIDRTVGFDREAVAAHANRIEELRRFVARYPPERVAVVTGIDAATIRSLAHDFAVAPAASVHMSTGVNMGRQGTLAYWLVHMLAFVTGNLDRDGGNVLPIGFYARAKAGRGVFADSLAEGEFGPHRRGDLPGNLLSHYILDAKRPIRALFVVAGNPVLSIGGEERLRRAMEKLDLLVCVDLYRNATGEYAHYLLPSTDQFERQDINITGLGLQTEPWVQFTDRVVPARHERREEWWIFAQLARAMGLRSIYDNLEEDAEPDEEMLWGRIAHMMASRGVSFEEVRNAAHGHVYAEPLARGDFFTRQIQTEDRRIDCCPPAFADALERCERIFAELAAEPQRTLKMISKREHNMHNSWYANLESMKRAGRDRNRLHMHPDDLTTRGLVDGQEVTVTNDHGRICVQVRADDGVLPGVVALAHGWGHERSSGMRVAQASPGANPNALLPVGPDSYEALSNQAFMTGIPVEVAATETDHDHS